MDTLLIERGNRLFLANTARVVHSAEDVDQDVASASDWDMDAKSSSPFLKWIAGDFVEADNPNSNKQFWTAQDLALGEYSIKYAPLNMLHKQRVPVGFFAATRTIKLGQDSAALADKHLKKPEKGLHRYVHPKHLSSSTTFLYYGGSSSGAPCVACGQPESSGQHDNSVPATGSNSGSGGSGDGGGGGDSAALHGQGTAKIQALSGMWSHIFPFESALVDQANDANSLFYSMEVRGTHIHCAGPNGCGKQFDYMDLASQCEHIKERTSIRHIMNPTFRGGALIIPPVKPGWANAKANVYEQAIRDEASLFAEQTEHAYDQLQVEGSDITPAAWEELMALVVTMGDHR